MTHLVGILNITPDSFSDGGLYAGPESALARMKELAAAGAHVIDIGAESTRPGAMPLSPEEEWRRLEPVLLRAKDSGFRLSIDTRHPETARRALATGAAHWINDVSGAGDIRMIKAVADSEAKLVFMHNLGIPANPDSALPAGCDPVNAIYAWAEDKIAFCGKNGLAKDRLIFDPGIGFGKTAEQSWTLIRRAAEFKKLGVPVLTGHSRKSFLKFISDAPPAQRDIETHAVTAWLTLQNIDYLRVHDVAGNALALRAVRAVTEAA